MRKETGFLAGCVNQYGYLSWGRRLRSVKSSTVNPEVWTIAGECGGFPCGKNAVMHGSGKEGFDPAKGLRHNAGGGLKKKRVKVASMIIKLDIRKSQSAF